MRLSLVLLFAFTSVLVKSQDVSLLTQVGEITFFGLDFTKATMIGDEKDFESADALVNKYFKACNNIIIEEPKKYDLEGYLNYKIVFELDSVFKFNSQINPDELFLRESNQFPNESILEITKKYADKSKNGVGFIFIVESFDKIKEKANYIAVYFKLNSGELISHQKVWAPPKGYGLRNYWGSCIVHVMARIGNKYNTWITYYGIDFTKAKMVGASSDFENPQGIVTKYFALWNEIIKKEGYKYDLSGALRMNILYSLDSANFYNSQVDPRGLVTTQENKLEQKDISEIYLKYTDSSKNGVGALFIVETFSKLKDSARIIFVLFDIKSGQLLHILRLEGKPSGNRFGSYWANAFFEPTEQIDKLTPQRHKGSR